MGNNEDTKDVAESGEEVTFRRGASRQTTLRILRKLALKLVVVDAHLRPCAGEVWRVEAQGEVHEGVVAPDGLVNAKVSPKATQATFTVGPAGGQVGGEPVTFQLALVKEEPLETTAGVQARLAQLGLLSGAVDGQVGPQTRSAVKAFERRFGLTPVGDPQGAPFVAALKAVVEREALGEDLDRLTTEGAEAAERIALVAPTVSLAGGNPEGRSPRGQAVLDFVARLSDVVLLPDKTALFLTGAQAVRYAPGRGALGDPVPLGEALPGLPAGFSDGVDAAVLHEPSGELLLFRGPAVLAYAPGRGPVGEPRRIVEVFPGAPEAFARDLDAAFDMRDGKLGLLKGAQVLRAARGAAPDAGFPKPFGQVFRNWPASFAGGSVNAATTWPNRRVYVFKGSEWICDTPGLGVRGDFWPRQTALGWSLAEANLLRLARARAAHLVALAERLSVGDAHFNFDSSLFVPEAPGQPTSDALARGHFHARLVTPDGQPVTDAALTWERDGVAVTGPIDGVTLPSEPGPDGVIKVDGLPWGSYVVHATPRGEGVHARLAPVALPLMGEADDEPHEQWVRFADDGETADPRTAPDASTTGAAAAPLEQGLPIVIAALRHLAENPTRTVLVAGHTDTVGSDEYNERLSAARARTVVALLEGDRDGFVAAASEFHNCPDDDAQVLAWVERTHGWPVDPGQGGPRTLAFQQGYNRDVERGLTEDGVLGPQTKKAAVRAFQHHHNASGRTRIGEDGLVGPATRGAYFDAYEAVLARLAAGDAQPGETDEALVARGRTALAELRTNLRWARPEKFDAFGERYPIELPPAGGGA